MKPGAFVARSPVLPESPSASPWPVAPVPTKEELESEADPPAETWPPRIVKLGLERSPLALPAQPEASARIIAAVHRQRAHLEVQLAIR